MNHILKSIPSIPNESQIKCECDECHLKNLVFAHLKEDEFNTLCHLKITESYPKGTVICKQGDEIKKFHYLKSGLVKIYKTNVFGKDQIIKIAKPFDFISLITVFSEKYYPYSVSALEDSEVCMLPLEDVKKMIEQNGKFALGIIEKMTKVSHSIIDASTEIHSKNLRGRVAYSLLFFADEIYKSDEFDLPISRREIGELIEMTTENVIRTLSEFRKDKILAIDGKRIKILKKDLLKKLCQFG